MDPCGRFVDTITLPYRTLMRCGTDLAQYVEVQWQYCEETALPLGFPTPFCSRRHDFHEIWPDIGEVQFAQRPVTKPYPTSPLPGTHAPCGDPDVWARGYQGHIPAAYPRNVFGQLFCCAGAAGDADVGVLGYVPVPPQEGVDVIFRRRRKPAGFEKLPPRRRVFPWGNEFERQAVPRQVKGANVVKRVEKEAIPSRNKVIFDPPPPVPTGNFGWLNISGPGTNRILWKTATTNGSTLLYFVVTTDPAMATPAGLTQVNGVVSNVNVNGGEGTSYQYLYKHEAAPAEAYSPFFTFAGQMSAQCIEINGGTVDQYSVGTGLVGPADSGLTPVTTAVLECAVGFLGYYEPSNGPLTPLGAFVVQYNGITTFGQTSTAVFTGTLSGPQTADFRVSFWNIGLPNWLAAVVTVKP